MFEYRYLVAAVASDLVDTISDVDPIAAEVHRLAVSNLLRFLRQDSYGHALYYAPELVAIERNLLRLSRTLRDCSWTDIPQSRLDRACAVAGLSAEQHGAARAATDGTPLAVIEGVGRYGRDDRSEADHGRVRRAGEACSGDRNCVTHLAHAARQSRGRGPPRRHRLP